MGHLKHASFIRWRPYQLSIWISQYIKPYCQLCHCRLTTKNPQLKTRILCDECHHGIDWMPMAMMIELDGQCSLAVQPISYYQYPLDQVIRNFKFYEDINMMPILYHMIKQLPPPNGCHRYNSVIVAMPTTHKRLEKRGFNPLSLLLPYLSMHWNIPVWEGVRRVDDRMSQVGLSKSERWENMAGAFQVEQDLPVNNVILFDDVATTGASLQALANSLLNGNPQLQLQAYCLLHGNSH